MILGKRIRLRAIERADLPRFVVWLNDPEVIQHLSVSIPISLGQEEQWYQAVLSEPKAEQPLCIEADMPEGWTPLGNISLMGIDWINRSAELGIFIGEKSYWNQGYGREAVSLMVRYAFLNLNLNRVFLRVDATNLRGIQAYKHAGFQHEGTMRQVKIENGAYIDMHIMSVLRSEWIPEEIE